MSKGTSSSNRHNKTPTSSVSCCLLSCKSFSSSPAASTSPSTNIKSQSNLGRAASPPLRAENNYATKSPMVIVGCPTFNPKIAASPSTFSTHLTHPSLDRPHSPPQTASRFNHPFGHSTLSRQTDRMTDGLGENSVPTLAYALLIV